MPSSRPALPKLPAVEPRELFRMNAIEALEPVAPPAVRARSARDVLLYVQKTRPEAGAEIERRMRPATWSTIMSAARTDWIEVALDHEVVDNIVGVLGEVEATVMWREFLGPHSKSPLLRGILSMAFRLLGNSPGSIVKFAPKALSQTYRNFFEVRVGELESRRAALALVDIAPEVLAHPAYIVCLRAVFWGFFDLSGCEGGELEFSFDASARRIDVQWRW